MTEDDTGKEIDKHCSQVFMKSMVQESANKEL